MVMVQPPIHASCVSLYGHGVLIMGPSGAGKSDLALRLIDRGAQLVSDDYTLITRNAEQLMASAPPTIAGKLEVRGLGIISMGYINEAPIALLIRLEITVERHPMSRQIEIMEGLEVMVVPVVAHEASAPIKVELALKQALNCL